MENEIDLIELFFKFFNLIKNKIKIIIVALCIGAILGAITFFIYPNVYIYKLIGFSPLIKENVVCNNINEISSVLNKNILTEFCESNNLDIKTFEKVKSINTNILKDSPESNIEIEILTKMPLNIANVSKGLENYISQNTYIQKELSLHEVQLKNTLELINQQIKKLENKKTINFNELKINLQEESSLTLYIKKNQYEKEFAFLKPIIFTNTSISPTLKKSSLIIFIIGGSFVAGLLIFISFFFQKINNLAIKEHTINSKASFYRKSA